MVIQGVSYPSDFEAKKAMIEIGRRMDEKSYAIAGDGSISVRVGPNAVWITAEGADKGALKQDSFIRVDLNGKQMPVSRQSRLPEDLPVHLQVYAQNPSLRGILHGYPAGAVAMAALGREVLPADYTPSVRALGKISLASAENMDAAARAAVLACKSDSGILLSGSGCVMWGESLAEAFHRIEALEYYVKITRILCGSHDTGSRCSKTAPVTGSETKAPAAYAEVMPEIEGLTPVIRPGEAAGFKLPDGGEQRQPVSAAPQKAYKPVEATASNARSSLASAPEADARPVPEAAAKREQMMAEVVRRSLAAMR